MTDRPYIDSDVGKTPKQLLAERTKRLQDAMQLKQPDRIPIQLAISYMLAEMYGVTRQEQHENGDKEQEMLEKAALHFQPDSIFGVFNNPAPSKEVGDRMTKFPGYGLDANGSFQFVEGEYMKPEDYDPFLEDPADWSIRKLWPKPFRPSAGRSRPRQRWMHAPFGPWSEWRSWALRLPPLSARSLKRRSISCPTHCAGCVAL